MNYILGANIDAPWKKVPVAHADRSLTSWQYCSHVHSLWGICNAIFRIIKLNFTETLPKKFVLFGVGGCEIFRLCGTLQLMNVLTNLLPVIQLIPGCTLIQLCLKTQSLPFYDQHYGTFLMFHCFCILRAPHLLYLKMRTLLRLCITCCETLLHNCYQSPWFLQVRDYCFQTCLFRLPRFCLFFFFLFFGQVASSPSCDGVNIFTRWSTASLAVISSRHPSVIPLVYIIALAWYYKITVSLFVHAMSFWKFLKKQDSLIDAIGKL